jgi:hypothetical protein
MTQSHATPRSTVLALTGLAVFAAAAAYLLILQVGSWTREAELNAHLAKIQRTYSGLEFTDQLKVKNLSKAAIKITTATLTYVDEATGELKTVHSGTYDYPSWDVQPGGTARLDGQMGRGRDWKGAVLFYSMTIEYPDVQPFLKAGAWARDLDAKEKALTVSLD